MNFSSVKLPQSRDKFHNGYFDNQLVDIFYAKMVQIMTINKMNSSFFLDIGANIGTFSLIPMVDNRMSCLAIEANPSVFEVLKETVAINGAEDKVFPLNIAVWDSKTTMPMTVHNSDTYSGIATMGTNDRGVENYFMSATHDTNYKKIEIPCDTVDNIISERYRDKKILGIKMDIEGAEYFAIKGAKETLLRDKPFILFENDKQHTDKFHHTAEDVIALLESYGYKKTWSTVSDVIMEHKDN